MKKIICCISMLCLLVGFALANPGPATRAASAGTVLYGSITAGKSPTGVYSTTTANPPTLTNFTQEYGFTPKTGVYANGNYYMFTAYERNGRVLATNLKKYDVSAWVSIQEKSPGDLIPTSLTYNTKDAKTYGCFPNYSNGYDFCSYDLDNCTKVTIGTLDQRFVAIFSDNDGTVYGIGQNGALYKFDLTTGEPTPIGATGVAPSQDIQDACYDEASNTYYWFAHTATESALYTIDIVSGAATKVTDFGNSKICWGGVFTKPSKAVVKPGFVSGLKTEFDKSSLSGNFVFTMPETSEAGDAISEKLTYVVFLDDEEYKTGEANPGAEVSVPVTVPTEGKHKFSVRAMLGDVSGQTIYTEKFIGQDTPKTPANLKAVKASDSNEVTISWDAVAEGVNAGYINTEAIKYALTRQPGNVVLGTDLTATSFTDKTINAMDNYTYEVVATDGVKNSDKATSATILVGEDLGIGLPYENSFLDGKGLGFFTAIDANEDGNTWTSNGKNVYYRASSTSAADDWLVSPKVKLEKGKYYHLSMDFMVSNLYKEEKFEVTYGRENSAAALTTIICSGKKTSTGYSVSEWFTPDETGFYYIGIHAMSDKDQGALAVTNFKLSAGINKNSPSAATDVSVTPGEMGGQSSEISFTCPNTNFAGAPLLSLSKAVVTNVTTGKEIASKTDITPGQAITVKDDAPAMGQNEYTVVCSNKYGDGTVATQSCWVGYDAPAGPTDVHWVQQGSQAVVTWKAPTVGKHGGYVDPNALTYSIYNAETQTSLKSDITRCSFVDAPSLTGQQMALGYVVYAVNTYGTSDPVYSNSSPFGYGYGAPFYESFADKKLSHQPWMINTVSGNNLWQLTGDLASSVSSQDGDNGMVGYTGYNAGAARLESPILTLSNLDKPSIKLWYYRYDTAADLKIQVTNDCGLTWTDVTTLPKDVLQKWAVATVDLSAYKTYNHLQVGIVASNEVASNPLFIDNITVDETYDHDMAIQKMTLPESAKAGTNAKGTVTVINNGRQTSGKYQVECYVDGNLYTTLQGSELAADATESFSLEIPVPLTNADNLKVRCKVVSASDENGDNDEAMQTIKVTPSKYPQPSDLKADVKADGKVTLTWAAPNTEYYAERTDDIESYESWSVGGIDVVEDKTTHEMIVTQDHGTLGDYTLIDNDHLATQFTYGTIGKGIPHLGDGMVCQVIDDKAYTNSSIMGAHSGNKMLCFWTSAQNDDYLILPELAPKNKHISFWAKSLSAKYGLESFEIMVSKTGKEPADFTVHQTITKVPIGYITDPEAGYKLYEFDLPEDTKYAAIHYQAKDVLALLIDDITCTPITNKENLTLTGYNIYCDGVKVNETPVTTTSFTDSQLLSDGAHRYNVTSVFSVGESSFSNTAQVSIATGIGEATLGSVRIYSADGAIVVEGLAGTEVAVYTIDGRLVQQVKAEAATRIPVCKGIYMVKTQQGARKVVVR